MLIQSLLSELMTTIELTKRLKELINLLSEDNELNKLQIEEFGLDSNLFTKLDTVLYSASSQQASSNVSSLLDDFQMVIRRIKSNYNIGSIYVEIVKLKQSLEGLELVYDDENNKSGILLESLAYFEKCFESFIKSYSPSSLVKLLFSMTHLLSTRITTIERFKQIVYSLEKKIVLKEGEQELSIYFYSTNKYQDLQIKLNNLEELYSRLCLSFNVSAAEYPLRLVKIETGSLWIYVIGHTAVISAIIWFLTATVKFIYRNYTIEGKISSIPRQLESADAILQFTKKLDEHGINCSSQDFI